MYKKSLDITAQSRDKKYFEKYSYVYNFFLPELAVLRSRNHSEIDRLIAIKKQWKHLSINFGGSWYNPKNEITETTINNLHNFLDMLNSFTEEHKLTISCDWGYFYTNSLDQIHCLHDLDYLVSLGCKKVAIDIPPNSILVKNSKHNYRTYLKAQMISEHEKQTLTNVLSNQSVRLGPAFQEFLYKYINSRYIADNYFIDHNDLSLLTVLGLASSLKIRKTINIVNDKYTHGKDTRKNTSSQAQ